MNFVAQVEEHLRDLGAEARKKHPGVKEASERAILQLRTLQNSYVTAVRKASQAGGEHPTTAIFQSQDLLRPFLLAVNYPNVSPKLLNIALQGMILLIEGNAICPGDGIHMVRVWTIQAKLCASNLTSEHMKRSKSSQQSSSSSWFGGILLSNNSANHSNSVSTVSTNSDIAVGSNGSSGSPKKETYEALALELLRSLLLLLKDESLSVTDAQWASSVALCCILGNVEALSVQQAARTALHQVLGLLMPRGAKVFTVETWRDLLILASREPTPLQGAMAQCKSSAPSPTLALELLCGLLQSSSKWVDDNWLEVEIESFQVCKLLLDNLSSTSFEFVWRSYAFTMALLSVDKDDSESYICENEGIQTAGILDKLPAEEEKELKELEECREQIFASLVQSIVRATDSCRNHHDFEDGFIYEGNDPQIKQQKGIKTQLACLIPDSTLWRAGLALEIVLSTIRNHSKCLMFVTEAASDFATVGASCRDHILLLVDAWEQTKIQSNRQESVEPTIPSLLQRAEAIQSAAILSVKLYDNTKNLPSTTCNMGDVLFIAFQLILEICRFVEDNSSFAPSLSVMQHFLKRLPGSADIIQATLVGYERLTRIIETGNQVQRQALISSLCKLSLPAWGKHDSSSQIQGHHIMTLVCLLKICQKYRNNILTEWHVLLCTLDELGSLSLASTKLTDDQYRIALLVSAVFGRFAPLSSTLSSDTIAAIMGALNEITKSYEKRKNTTISEISSDSKVTLKEETSISEKIINFAGNAIMGVEKNNKGEKHGESIEAQSKVHRVKSSFASAFKQDFYKRLLSSRGLRSETLSELPLSLMWMTDISLCNLYRLKTVGPPVFEAFCELASSCKEARIYAMDMLSLLVICKLSDKPIPVTFAGPAEVHSEPPSPNFIWQVESKSDDSQLDDITPLEVIMPLCNAIESTTQASVAEAGISSLHTLLEGLGHNLDGKVWSVIIKAVSSLAGDASYLIDRTGSDWSNCCTLAFRCLKLIVDDFLDELPTPNEDFSMDPRIALMECCSSFGTSKHELNISLTSVGLLWTIADQDSERSSIDRTFEKLVNLSADSRTEVRNCAINTLFSCIVGRGQVFSPDQWERCICQTVFSIYDKVLNRGGVQEDEVSLSKNVTSTKYRTAVHHSRNSQIKQWNTTESLVLQGLSRVLRNYFETLLETTATVRIEKGQVTTKDEMPWFVGAWSRLLELALRAAKLSGDRDTLELRCSGVDLMVLCLQCSCRAGMQAAITPARVGTNMEVVNGALRNMGDSKGMKDCTTPKPKTSYTSGFFRLILFNISFDTLLRFQDHLESSPAEMEETKASRFSIEPVQAQVLQRLVTGLSKAYECMKDDEFDGPNSNEKGFELAHHDDDIGFEDKFVVLVVTVANKAVGENRAYLSQAQRVALDLLRDMADYGSNVSLKGLTSIAGPAFFWKNESIVTESEVLAREAASIVSDQINNLRISDKARVEILLMVLLFFSGEYDKEFWKIETPNESSFRKIRNYSLFLPIIKAGLASARKLSVSDVSEDSGILDTLWNQAEMTLNQMMTPIRIPSHAPYFSQALNLVQILKSMIFHAPIPRTQDVAALLCSGALKAIDIAKDHVNGISDDKIRSRKRCDDALKIYKVCVSGICHLQPNGVLLSSLSRQILQDVIFCLGDNNCPFVLEVVVEIAILTCQAIQENQNMESLVMKLYSLLCPLLTTEFTTLNTEVALVLKSVDITRKMEETTSLMDSATKKAEIMECENKLILAKVRHLEEEISRLQQEIAVYSASSALS